MPQEFIDHHITGSSNINMLLGEYPITISKGMHIKTLSHEFTTLTDSADSNYIIIGLQLSPPREAIHWLTSPLGFKSHLQGTLNYFEREMGELGWKIEESIAAFPNLESARFCFPMTDTNSHRFLINEILFSRRYSLAIKTRTLLWIYKFLVSILPRPTFLYRAVYIRIRRP
jgi:hypothetical protein